MNPLFPTADGAPCDVIDCYENNNFMYKLVYFKVKEDLIFIEAACNVAKSQDCFQISAHMSLLSEMLMAHQFSKISPESKM